MNKRKIVFSVGEREFVYKSLSAARSAYSVAESVLSDLGIPREEWPLLIIRAEIVYGG